MPGYLDKILKTNKKHSLINLGLKMEYDTLQLSMTLFRQFKQKKPSKTLMK